MFFFLLAVVPVAKGQEPQEFSVSLADSLSRKNRASILFERNLNTFNWIGSLIVDTTAGGNRIRLSETYASNVILLEGTSTTPEQRLQSNQQRLLLQLSRPLTEDLSARAQWSSFVYSDKKAVGLSTASVNSILAGFEYAPFPLIILNPMAGHRWDNQTDVRDRGLSYAISARTNNIELDGYRIDGSAQYHQDRIDPRLLEQHFARLGTEKHYLGRTRDSLELGFSRNRREFYTATTGLLESRVENIFSVANLLEYEMDPRMLTSLYVHVYSRALEKGNRILGNGTPLPGTGIDEFRLDAYVQAEYRDVESGLLASVRLLLSERNEEHSSTDRLQQAQEQTKDNFARRTSLTGILEFPVSSSDHVSLSGAASILRYDTPSALNVEDRDELLVAVALSTTHRISRHLDIGFTVDGTLNHIVYLLQDRSANNNINRVLRFSPATVYRPFAALTTANRFEVLANYTVYDFETDAAQIRSFSYRQFGWEDSTSLELTDRVGLDFLAYLKLYDRGQLNWQEFTERRENSFVDKTYALQARYSPGPGTVVAAGIRYFSQSRYSYSGDVRRLESFLRSFGPTCLILWRLSPYSEVGLKGWYEQRRVEGGATRNLANMTLNVNITL